MRYNDEVLIKVPGKVARKYEPAAAGPEPEPELQPGPEPSATRGDSVVDSDVQQGGRFADATRGRSQAEIVAAVRSADPSWLCASAGAPRDVGVDAPGHQCEPSVGN